MQWVASGSARTCSSCRWKLNTSTFQANSSRRRRHCIEEAGRQTDKPKPRDSKWVLVVNLNPGSVAGGSGAQYFIGNFDGKKFTAGDIIDPATPPPGKLFQNFEGGTTFAGLGWTATGDFVGKGPVTGNLPGQGGVSGFLGKQLVNTFFNGDSSVGTITSPTFTVRKNYINLLVGGGNHPHDPNTSDAPQPAGDLLFPGADVEPTVPGTTTYEELGWTATGGLVGEKVPTGAIGGQQPVSGFLGNGLINTFTNGSDQAHRHPHLTEIHNHQALYQLPDRGRKSSLSGQQRRHGGAPARRRSSGPLGDRSGE